MTLFSLLVAFVPAAVAMSANGMTNCPCLNKDHQTLVTTHAKFDCTRSYGVDGKCSMPTVGGQEYPYPPDYGIGCGAHEEPGNSDCFNVNNTSYSTKKDTQADWCTSAWCYVDECDCGDTDAAPSVYFTYTSDAGESKNPYYSYKTCESVDTFTTEETNANAGAERGCTEITASRGYVASMVPLTMFVVALLPVFLQ